MKKLLISLFVLAVLVACNNGAGNNESVGDSVDADPTTAQPITTEPDTIGPAASDTTQHQANPNH